jgi:hypothetical protein
MAATPLFSPSSSVERDADRIDGYNCDAYVRNDLNSRVFVDFEVFIKSVLHIPHDWKTRWGPAIEAVKVDEKFTRCRQEYCNETSSQEEGIYELLMGAVRAVFDVLSASKFSCISGTPHYRHAHDLEKDRGEAMDRVHLSPDLVVLRKRRQPTNKHLRRENTLRILTCDGYIYDGKDIPRLVVDGKPVASLFRGWRWLKRG